jgi:SAM-dependent methyltransferase
MKDLRAECKLAELIWYRLPKPRGKLGIRLLGYAGYVGGLWEEAGAAQFRFLYDRGLKPQHYLLDIGCGSLRGGVKFIPYLDAGHYMGVDQEPLLIQLGLEKELDPALNAAKRPRFLISDSFQFEQLDHRPDYALAVSLFTHLPEPLILDCLRKLRKFIREDGVFYASFVECGLPQDNPAAPHPHRSFSYTRQQMLQFGQSTGWTGEACGILKPGVGQQLVRFRPC